MKVIGESFKEDVKIDRFALETECQSQADIYAVWGEQWAEAKNRRDIEKDKLDLVFAQQEIAIRNNASSNGVKVTEAIIKAMVEEDAEVLKQKQIYRDACRTLYSLDVAISSINQRGGQLDNLVRLHVNSYYQRESGTGDIAKNIRDNL